MSAPGSPVLSPMRRGGRRTAGEACSGDGQHSPIVPSSPRRGLGVRDTNLHGGPDGALGSPGRGGTKPGRSSPHVGPSPKALAGMVQPSTPSDCRGKENGASATALIPPPPSSPAVASPLQTRHSSSGAKRKQKKKAATPRKLPKLPLGATASSPAPARRPAAAVASDNEAPAMSDETAEDSDGEVFFGTVSEREQRARKKVKSRRRTMLHRVTENTAVAHSPSRIQHLRTYAAIVIQSRARMQACRRAFHRRRAATLVLQSWARMLACRSAFRAQRDATVTIQGAWRACRRRDAEKQAAAALSSSESTAPDEDALDTGQDSSAVQTLLQPAVSIAVVSASPSPVPSLAKKRPAGLGRLSRRAPFLNLPSNLTFPTATPAPASQPQEQPRASADPAPSPSPALLAALATAAPAAPPQVVGGTPATIKDKMLMLKRIRAERRRLEANFKSSQQQQQQQQQLQGGGWQAKEEALRIAREKVLRDQQQEQEQHNNRGPTVVLTPPRGGSAQLMLSAAHQRTAAVRHQLHGGVAGAQSTPTRFGCSRIPVPPSSAQAPVPFPGPVAAAAAAASAGAGAGSEEGSEAEGWGADANGCLQPPQQSALLKAAWDKRWPKGQLAPGGSYRSRVLGSKEMMEQRELARITRLNTANNSTVRVQLLPPPPAFAPARRRGDATSAPQAPRAPKLRWNPELTTCEPTRDDDKLPEPVAILKQREEETLFPFADEEPGAPIVLCRRRKSLAVMVQEQQQRHLQRERRADQEATAAAQANATSSNPNVSYSPQP